MYLLILALAPGIAIMLYIYSKDKYNREPLKYILICFVLGALSILPALFAQLTLRPVLDNYYASRSIGYYALFAWGLVGLSEEGSKFLVLRYYAYPKKAFDEPFDGIIYSVMAGMGFATLENIFYVTSHGFMTGLLRMVLSVPAHASFAVLMGYHAGLAKFDTANSALHLAKGFLLAVLFHGAFDFFLFIQGSDQVTRYVSTGLLSFGAILSYWIAIRMSLKSINQHQALSKNEYDKNNHPAGI